MILRAGSCVSMEHSMLCSPYIGSTKLIKNTIAMKGHKGMKRKPPRTNEWREGTKPEQ